MATLLDGIQRYYRLDSNGTEEVSAQDGVPTGSVTYSAGKRGTAADFAGDTARRIVAPGLDLVTDLSISMWIYPTSNGGGFAGILTHQLGAGAVDTNYHVDWNSGSVSLYGTGNATVGAATPPLNAWSHIVITRTTAGAIKYYLNGRLVSSGNSVGPHSVPTADLWIGGRPDLFNAFPGLVDEVGIWDIILGQNAITTLFGEGTPPDFADFGDDLSGIHVVLPMDLFSQDPLNYQTVFLPIDLSCHDRGQQTVPTERFASLYDKVTGGPPKFNPGFN